jgi:dTDP-4-dehydrorhamnose reductase
MKTLLLTGATGFLGYNFLHQVLSCYNIVAVTHQRNFSFPKNIKTIAVNLANTESINNALNSIRPHTIVHLAAISNANFCEENQGLSQQVNVAATLQLATWCSNHQAQFIFTSTDLVFDGTKGNYNETDTVNPLSIYGKQKAEAEKRVLEIYPKACVLRMPLMFGYGGTYAHSFMQPFLQKLQNGEALQLFTDEFRSVVGGYSAAKGILQALNNNWQGLFHLGGKEKLSRYDFGLLLCEVFGIDKKLIVPTLQKEVKMAAPRPADVTLNTEKAFGLGYSPLTALDELKLISKAHFIL